MGAVCCDQNKRPIPDINREVGNLGEAGKNQQSVVTARLAKREIQFWPCFPATVHTNWNLSHKLPRQYVFGPGHSHDEKKLSIRTPELTLGNIEEFNIDSNEESPQTNDLAARELMFDEEMNTLAIKIAEIFPGIPLLGIDFIKHSETGELFALEINGGGNTWNFSSRLAEKGRRVISKEDRVKQFDAWNVCARALVEKTRSHAS